MSTMYSQEPALSEALIHSAVCCGFPKALNAVAVAKRVFADRGRLPVGGDARETASGGAEQPQLTFSGST
jgi:hypothetical protein